MVRAGPLSNVIQTRRAFQRRAEIGEAAGQVHVIVHHHRHLRGGKVFGDLPRFAAAHDDELDVIGLRIGEHLANGRCAFDVNE